MQSFHSPMIVRALLAALVTLAASQPSAANWIERWPWVSIEFGGPTWRAVPDREIDDLGQSLATAKGALAGKLRRGLATPAGRLELDARLAVAAREARQQNAVRAMSAYLVEATLPALPARGGDGTIAAYRLPAEHPQQALAELQVLSGLLERIRAGLPAGQPLAARLARLLAQPQAAAAVLVAYVFPAAYPNPLYSKLGGWFRRRSDGGLVLLASRRADAATYGTSLRPMRAAVDRVMVEFSRIGAQLAGDDALSRRLVNLLRDPIYAAVAVLSAVSMAPKAPAERLAERLVDQVNAYLDEAGGRLRLKAGVDREGLAATTAVLERLVFAARISRARLVPFAQAIDDSAAPERRMKELLGTDLAAVALTFEAAKTKSEDRFLLQTVLGGTLLAKGANAWRVNPKRTTQLRLQLEFLESLLENYRSILSQVRAPKTATPAYVHVGRLAVLAAEAARARSVQPANWQRWVKNRFRASGRQRVPRGAAEPQLRALAGAMEAAAGVDAYEPAIRVDFRGAPFDKSRLHLLRSSAFYNPRTPFGQQAYLSGFKNHSATRLFGVFDFPAGNARDRADFTRLLNRHSRWILDAGPFQDRIMVYISAMPRWLSESRDEGQRNDVPAYTLYSTRDWKGWADVVGETVRLVRQIRGPQRYYEIWNEPESYWAAGTEAYLKLYEETARIIRAEDPEAKIGGAAVNAWDGRAGGSRGGDALNLELLRFAKRKGVPLDFVSWHHFRAPLEDLKKAKSVYLAEAERLGLSPLPEMVVSEWNPPGENTEFEAVAFAETMLALYQADVAFQTVAAWEEFGAIPNPAALGPWGMITQQHFVKPMAHVHALFDRFARNSLGVAELTPPKSTTRVIASRKPGGVYELLIWEVGYEPPLEAALKVLGEAGLGPKEAATYGSLTDLEAAIRAAKPRNAAHRKAFERARRAYNEKLQQRNFVNLKVAGVNSLEVLASTAVAALPVARPVRAVGDRLLADVRRNEVLWVRLRVDGGGG